MTRSSLLLLPLAFVLSTGGCVGKAKHEATLRDLEQARQTATVHRDEATRLARTLDAREARIDELEGLVAEGQRLAAEKTELEQQIAEARVRIDALDARAAKAEHDLADVIKRRAGLKASLDKMTEALAEVAARQLAAERRVAEYRDMLARFRSMIDAGTLDVKIIEGRMVLTMPMDILFASGSARLSSAGKETLQQVGATLARIADKRFQVDGHTDNVPIRNERYASNWELAAARALVVVHSLVNAGVGPQQLSAASFSEFVPRADNASETGRAANRRIEIVVVPDLRDLPGHDELERLSNRD